MPDSRYNIAHTRLLYYLLFDVLEHNFIQPHKSYRSVHNTDIYVRKGLPPFLIVFKEKGCPYTLIRAYLILFRI